MAINWYEGLPGDSDVVSQHPAAERTFRASIKAGFEVEHSSANGRHVIGAGSDAARNAINGSWVEGNMWVSGQDGRIRLQRAASVVAGVPGLWQQVSSEFEPGCIMLFANNTAPTGWVQIGWNDAVVRIVNGAAGGVGGSWAITGLSNQSADHSHTYSTNSGNESANHTHGVSGTTDSWSGGSQGTSPSGGPTTPINAHTHTFSASTGGMSNSHFHGVSGTTSGISVGHSHTGDGNWRPVYVNFMACQKS